MSPRIRPTLVMCKTFIADQQIREKLLGHDINTQEIIIAPSPSAVYGSPFLLRTK